MKRLITITVAATVVLLIVSLTHGHTHAGHSAPAAGLQPTASWEPRDVARTYLTALLTGDLNTAETNSTQLLARQLASQPPRPSSLDEVPVFDLLTLDRAATFTDLAVEMHWPDGRIAALRIQLGLIDGRWLVAGVQP
jgi:hypothetical protein